MTKFERILIEKRVVEFLENLETLSESQAAEVIDQLDEQTVRLIEAVLNEITAGTLKRIKRDVARGKLPRSVLGPAQQSHRYRERIEQPLSRMSEKGFSPQKRREMRRASQKADAERRRKRLEGQPEQRTPGDATNRLASIYDPALTPTNNREQQRDFERDTMRGF
jgi:hypothetical protein